MERIAMIFPIIQNPFKKGHAVFIKLFSHTLFLYTQENAGTWVFSDVLLPVV
jgi:hypothetical protein